MKQRDKLRQQVHPIYNDPEKLAKGIKELERRLTTESLDRATENKIVKEIEQVKQSKPVFAKMDELSKKIESKKEEKSAAGGDLPELKKVIKNIKAEIDKIKQKEQIYVDDKSSFSTKIVTLKKKLDDAYSAIRLLRGDKNVAKEDFYSQMIEFEKQ